MHGRKTSPIGTTEKISVVPTGLVFSLSANPGTACRAIIIASLIVGPHPLYGCVSPSNLEASRFVFMKLLTHRFIAINLALKRFEHAPFHYELRVPAFGWLPLDFRVKRCALVRQRILRCRPARGLYYKGCDGPKPACSYQCTEER